MELGSAQPTLLTPRLVLRALEPRDDSRYWRLRTDPILGTFSERDPWPTVAHAREERQKLAAGIGSGRLFFWALSERANGPLAGTVWLWDFNASLDEAELGFELLPSYQGRGWMTEALRAVIEFAASRSVRTLSVLSPADNVAAVNLVQKLGFHPAGSRDDGLLVWALSVPDSLAETFANDL